MDKHDVHNMGAVVARALAGVETEAEWAEINDEDQAQLLVLAHRAVAAHHAFLMELGFKILPAGTVAVPSTKEEARAMVMAVQQFHKGEKLIKPKLISPTGRALN